MGRLVIYKKVEPEISIPMLFVDVSIWLKELYTHISVKKQSVIFASSLNPKTTQALKPYLINVSNLPYRLNLDRWL